MPFDLPVIRTKIIVPRRRSEILSRPRLLKILENVLDLKLLILAAPAGYGKTSLLVDFAYHTQVPVCWYALDSLDGDPQRFIAHFVSSIASRFPAFGEASFAALGNLNQDTLDLNPVISAIVNDAYEHITEHFVFVLDDYHLIRDSKPIDGFINRISQEMSENCHLIIASRTLLTLPDLTLLVARSQVGGLSFEELAFLPEEIKQLMSVNYRQNLSEEGAEELVKQTEGWITGLLLTAQLSPQGTDDRLRLARVSGIGVYEYLTEQVFNRQSEEMRAFLQRTSLFEEISVSLCEQVLQPSLNISSENWQEKINVLQRDNLFVLPVDDEMLVLRYHHLFRDFLTNRMRLDRPDETAQIESKLAIYYEQKKEWERALAIYARIGQPAQIAELIRKSAPSMILGGRLVSLTSWLDSLTEDFVDLHPELLSIRGTIAMLRGDSKKSLELLNRSIEGLRKSDYNYELAITLVRRSSVNRYFGNYDLAMQDVEEALQLCAASHEMDKVKAEALRTKGINLFHMGELRPALETLKEAIRGYRTLGEKMDAVKVLLDLGVVYRALGQFTETEKCYQESLEYWQSTQNALWQANLLNNIGVLQHLRGQYEEAAATFERAISYARLAVNPRLEGFALTSLGDLLRDIQALPDAKQAYKQARVISEGIDDLTLKIFLTLSEAILERKTHNDRESQRLIEEALELARKGGSKYEVNLCLLEYYSLHFKEGKLEGLEEGFTSVYEFFVGDGHQLNSLITRFYTVMLSMVHDSSEEANDALSKVLRACKTDIDNTAITQIGMEYKQFLIEHLSDRYANADGAAFLKRIKEFEQGLVHKREIIRRGSTAIQVASPKIVIRAFGKAMVRIGDRTIPLSDWKTQVVRDLFFFLLLHPDGVTKEEIGSEFWPESTTDTVRLRFKNTIYRVRRAVGSDRITFIDDNYRFNESKEYDYDVQIFLEDLKNAKASREPTSQIQYYKHAISIYKGAYLPKLDYDWVLIQREQYHQKFISAIINLVNLYIQTEQYPLAIHYANRVIEEDPCQETAYRSAMLAYSALGDRPGIARQFEKCKAVLKKELDVEPALQTQNLFNTLMQQSKIK
jgi:LuxR family maltose regulon positive regulatory protein